MGNRRWIGVAAVMVWIGGAPVAEACEIEIETATAELRNVSAQAGLRERAGALLERDPGNLAARNLLLQLIAEGAKAQPDDAEHVVWLIEACPMLAVLSEERVLSIRDQGIARAWRRAERLHLHRRIHVSGWSYRVAQRPLRIARSRLAPTPEQLRNQQIILQQTLQRDGPTHPRVKQLARTAYRSTLLALSPRLPRPATGAELTDDLGEILIYAAQSAELSAQPARAARLAGEVLAREELWSHDEEAYAVLIRLAHVAGDRTLERSLQVACGCSGEMYWPRRPEMEAYPW